MAPPPDVAGTADSRRDVENWLFQFFPSSPLLILMITSNCSSRVNTPDAHGPLANSGPVIDRNLNERNKGSMIFLRAAPRSIPCKLSFNPAAGSSRLPAQAINLSNKYASETFNSWSWLISFFRKSRLRFSNSGSFRRSLALPRITCQQDAASSFWSNVLARSNTHTTFDGVKDWRARIILASTNDGMTYFWPAYVRLSNKCTFGFGGKSLP